VTDAYPVLHVGSFGSPERVRPARPWTRTFRGLPASVPEARRFVAELLAGCPAREALMTCVSELCANAIAHTASGNGGVFIVELDLSRPGVARLAVTDEGSLSVPAAASLDLPGASLDLPGASLDLPGASLDLPGEGGRGLALVAACTTRWGYADAHPGRTVWAEASWPVPVPGPGGAGKVGGDDPGQRAREARRRRVRRPAPARPDDWPPGPAA
jgi:serine/threonine-protein kinase RsbW